jgi:GDSL-like Lipase/Acylhydrolase family
MKILVVGNSVGFKIRPPRFRPEDGTYAELLERAGHSVVNVSMAGAFLSEQFSLLDDDVLTEHPDVVILHHGVIEVFFRRTIRSWNNAGITNQYRNRVLRQGYSTGAPRLAVRAINALTRRLAAAFGWRWQWQSPDVFLRVVEATAALILKETGARLVIVGITPPSASAEAELPGLGGEFARVNERLRDCAAALGDRAGFLDVEALLSAESHAEMVPDGIHFSAAGHRRVADALLQHVAPGTAR